MIFNWITICINLYRFATDIGDSVLLDKLSEKESELILVLLDSSFHTRVPVILDRIVCPSLEKVCNISPLISLISV